MRVTDEYRAKVEAKMKADSERFETARIAHEKRLQSVRGAEKMALESAAFAARQAESLQHAALLKKAEADEILAHAKMQTNWELS